ncbi:superoxide dismutase, Ni [Algihabitans sp.]|uniref:superoxide dismutase, Ni n=1 Tax=Algihabitans sp. TaxID=2821514 RepID=UPI003BA9B07C
MKASERSKAALASLLRGLDRVGLIGHAKGHCDIPCGIYDPGPALIAAVSVVRLMDIMHEGKSEDAVALANLHARCALRKEEEAEKVKQEIRVIWGDYFKAPLIEKHPEVHGLVHSIMQKASACKQDVHRDDGLALVELVNRFAELFWQTKGIKTAKGTCPYPPALTVVYPVLEA